MNPAPSPTMALFSGVGSGAAAAIPSGIAAAPYIQWLARFGYAARGTVYLIVGYLGLQSVLARRQQPEDSSGALQHLLSQPFGRILLGAVAVGLAGWVIWRLFQSIADPEQHGAGFKGLAVRAGYLISALLYGGLALEAVRLLLGSAAGGRSGERSADHWTATVMQEPAGRWIIAGVGAVVLGFGLVQLIRAFRTDFREHLNLASLSTAGQRRVVFLGRLGISARGLVFGVIGWFLVRAAWEARSQQARGFAGALEALQEQPYGAWLLGGVSIGLICYGLFQFMEARYRVIRTRTRG